MISTRFSPRSNMTLSKSLNPSVMTVHCEQCLSELPEGQSPGDYARQQIGLTETADLVVWCMRHDSPIAMHKQGQIDSDLLAVVNKPCAGCGKVHAKEDKEMRH